MAIKAIFTEGLTSLTVNGLHQWDYGQTLEIHDNTLLANVEVHFGYPGAREAIVRNCNKSAGVITVAIPDVCLEQPAPVMVWVYEVGETAGQTVRTVVLPIIARTRPAAAEVMPEEVKSLYNEAIANIGVLMKKYELGVDAEAAVTAAAEVAQLMEEKLAEVGQKLTEMGALKSDLLTGSVKVALATKADKATNAGNANTATAASYDPTGHPLAGLCDPGHWTEFDPKKEYNRLEPGLYMFSYWFGSIEMRAGTMIYVPEWTGNDVKSDGTTTEVFRDVGYMLTQSLFLSVTGTGEVRLGRITQDGTTDGKWGLLNEDVKFFYRKIL